MGKELIARTAVDAIRCVYLARIFERKGDLDAAGHWQNAADRWAGTNSSPRAELSEFSEDEDVTK